MRKIVILIILSIALANCNYKQKTNDVNSSNKKTFNEFIGKIPIRETPIELSCGLPDGPGSDNINVSNFEEYKEFIPPNFDVVYGVIGRTGKFKIIIYGQTGDDIYPTLFTYDNLGKRIDSLELIVNPCGCADEFQIPYSSVNIDNEFQIFLVDTTRYIHYSDNNNDFVTDSLKAIKIKYYIDNKGQINKE